VFVVRPRIRLQRGALERCFTLVGSGLTCKH
jgi:hypothetical protein